MKKAIKDGEHINAINGPLIYGDRLKRRRDHLPSVLSSNLLLDLHLLKWWSQSGLEPVLKLVFKLIFFKTSVWSQLETSDLSSILIQMKYSSSYSIRVYHYSFRNSISLIQKLSIFHQMLFPFLLQTKL